MLNMTHAMDGYPGIEHTIPILPMYDDVVQLFKATQTTNTPTLLVTLRRSLGRELLLHPRERPVGDAKLRQFTPREELDSKVAAAEQRPRAHAAGSVEEEYAFKKHAEFAKDAGRGRRARRRRQPRAAPGPGLPLGALDRRSRAG